MPADSEPGPALPQTFRPFGVRVVILVTSVLLLTIVVVMWVSLPADIRAEFTAFQLGTLVLIGAGFYAAGYALARSRVVARAEGLTIVNGYRTRRFEWNEVLSVSLRSGAPWAELDLSDGTSIAAMGIQGSDGPRALRQVREVRALVARLTRPA